MTGRETEGRCMDCLQYHGFQVYQPPKAKYREQDVFGLFDVLAFGHGKMEMIQVKGGSTARGIEDWTEFAREFEEELTDVSVSMWHRKQEHWRILVPAPDSYEVAYDGRKSDVQDFTRIEDYLLPE